MGATQTSPVPIAAPPQKSALASAVDVMWKGVPLPVLPSAAFAAFMEGLVEGAVGQIHPQDLLDLKAKLLADPIGYQLAYTKGVLSGLLTGLKNLFTAVAELGKLAIELSPAAVTEKVAKEVYYLLTDRAHRELRKRQAEQAQQIAVAVKETILDINRNPGDYVDMSRQVGVELGKHAGTWFTHDLIRRSTKEIGELLGSIVGQVLFEIILAIVLELTTAGIGELVRGGLATGEGVVGGSRVAGLVERLKLVLSRSKGIQKFIRLLTRGEEGVEAAAELRKFRLTWQNLAEWEQIELAGPGGRVPKAVREGGHLLEKHIYITDDALRLRAPTLPEKIATKFNDPDTAVHTINRVLESNQSRIHTFLSGLKPGEAEFLELTDTVDTAVGYGYRALPDGSIERVDGIRRVTIWLQSDGLGKGGWLVRTAYPVP